jgi:hypothetical protein
LVRGSIAVRATEAALFLEREFDRFRATGARAVRLRTFPVLRDAPPFLFAMRTPGSAAPACALDRLSIRSVASRQQAKDRIIPWLCQAEFEHIRTKVPADKLLPGLLSSDHTVSGFLAVLIDCDKR